MKVSVLPAGSVCRANTIQSFKPELLTDAAACVHLAITTLAINTRRSRCGTSDRKWVGHQNAAEVIRSRLLYFLLLCNISPLEGDIGRVIAADARPQLPLTPTHVQLSPTVISATSLKYKDTLIETPIWIIEITLLFGSVFPTAHPQCLTFRCQISPIGLLGGGKLWWRIFKRWDFILFGLEKKGSGQGAGSTEWLERYYDPSGSD